MNELTATIERITYRADDTGYTVAKVQPAGKKALVAIVGRLPDVQVGETLHMQGTWVDHRTHGRQFEVSEYRVAPPTTTDGIVRYLSSGLLPGVGAVTAQRIADEFGASTLDILDQQPQRLKEVKGLGQKKIAAIISAWEQQRSIKELLMLGQDMGLSTQLAIKIFKTYGDIAVEIVRGDPYRMAIEIEGIGFPTADNIARSLGIALDSIGRITAGLRYTLSLAANQDGHCALTEHDLVQQTAIMLELNRETIQRGVDEACQAVLLVRDGDLIYLPALYHAETELAANLYNLLHADTAIKRTFQPFDQQALRGLLRERDFALTLRQVEAVMMALHSPVFILTGGPGTGKTTTVRAILALLQSRGFTATLTAPTGRAARRLAETAQHPAATIHRTLEFMGGTASERWGRNEQYPLDADMIVVDEVSMLDILLAHHLIKAVKRGAHVLFVGDEDQLPSVGPGAVLRDLLAAHTILAIHLNTIFRQSADSDIISNAHAINHGKLPNVNKSEVFFFKEPHAEACAALIVDLLINRIPSKFPQFDPIHDIQVLAPTHRGPAGVGELNAMLQTALNPPNIIHAEATIGNTLYRVGDRVIQQRNNYDLDVSNGDLGIITAIDNDERTVTIQYDEQRTVVYQWNEMDEVQLAYAISVHKAQGAEYPVVVIPLLRYYGVLLNRSLLYTAVTRAKQLVVLVGDWRAVEQAVANQRDVGRITGLRFRL